MNFIKSFLNQTIVDINNINIKDVKKIISLLNDGYHEQRQIFIIGNGGSASLASHFACDLGKGTIERIYDNKEKRFRVMSLTDNVSLLTAYANDVGYDDIFSQQLKNLVQESDIVIVITGSGNSKNILKAIETAEKVGAITIGFLGFDGGKAKKLLDYSLVVPSSHYGRIEAIHGVLIHLVVSYLSDLKKKGYEEGKRIKKK